MEERAGVRGTLQGGVFFTEAAMPNARVLHRVRVEISRHNANLTQIKAQLAAKVVACGGNALTNFRYGQRAHSWWEFAKWDNESWHGEGDAVVIPGEADDV